MNGHFFGKTVLGLVLIGAGVLFLLNQTGAVELNAGRLFADYWPVILIFFGLKGIVIQRKLEYGWGGSYIWNVFIVLLGGYFLLRNLDIDLLEGVNLWQFAAPVLLILFGLSMLGRGSRYEEHKSAMREQRRQYKEQKIREKLEYKARKLHERANRKYRHHGHGHGAPDSVHEEPDPVYDPSYSRKIEQDLDQAFQERVVKKLSDDDPFPLVSETKTSSGTKPPVGDTPNREEPSKQKQNHQSWNPGWHHTGYNGRTIDRSNFIGDIHLGHDYWVLEPTNISHFIGDTVIDLTKANIPYGETKITVSAFIGDVKVFVPNDIQVEISVTASAFIGDMKVMDRHEGGLFRHMQYDSHQYMEAEKKIRLTVSMFIGDVFVKRVG